MSILEVSGTSPVRSPTPAPVQPVQRVEAPKPAAAPLEPAVRLDIRSGDRPVPAVEEERPVEAAPVDQKERRITIDEDTKSLVYQLVDGASGDIVIQLPDPVVLKARAYAEAAAAKLEAAERPLDRTA